MTILILDSDPKKIAEMLDDKHLSKMIKSTAQVLCNAHYKIDTFGGMGFSFYYDKKPSLSYSFNKDEWSKWTSTCIANYRYLVELGMSLWNEFFYRNEGKALVFDKKQKSYFDAIEWCQNHEPDLPENTCAICNGSGHDPSEDITFNDGRCPKCYGEGELTTPFPLVMPKKFQIPYGFNEKQFNREKNFFNSYRNYYKHLIEKMENRRIKCPGIGDIGHYPHEECNSTGYINKSISIKWIRREKPEFLR